MFGSFITTFLLIFTLGMLVILFIYALPFIGNILIAIIAIPIGIVQAIINFFRRR